MSDFIRALKFAVEQSGGSIETIEVQNNALEFEILMSFPLIKECLDLWNKEVYQHKIGGPNMPDNKVMIRMTVGNKHE